MAEPQSQPEAPTATGTLATTPLAHALVYARNKRLTGIFELRAHETGAGASLIFWRGRVASVTTTPHVCFLGPLLFELGLIDTPVLDATLKAVAETKRLHGEILVERGAITAAQRDSALVEQVCRKVHHLFSLPSATTFAFYERRATVDEPKVLVDPLAPIWRGLREAPPEANIRDVLERYPTSSFKMVNEAPLDRIGLGPEERLLVTLLTTRLMTLAQLREASTLPRLRIDLLVYVLVIAKCVEPVSASQASMQAPVPPSQPRLPLGATPAATWVASQASQTSMRAVSLGPSMGSGEVRRSVPSFRVPSTASMPPVVAPGAGGERGADASSIPPTSQPKPLLGPTELGASGIALRASRIEHEDYFSALGLPEGASAEAVRATYFRLAKVWHPDRLPRELEPFRAEVSAIFSHLTHAHATLTDETARKGYMATRGKKSGPPSAIVREKNAPDAILKDVEKAIARRDFASAERSAIAASEQHPEDAEALALLAWSRARAGEASEDAIRALLPDLDRAIVMREDSARARYFRAMVNKRLGNVAAAMRDFAHAARIDPNHVDAIREIRLYNMRGPAKKK